jgi:hypothetical protein
VAQGTLSKSELLNANGQLIQALDGGGSAEALAGPDRLPQAEAAAATADQNAPLAVGQSPASPGLKRG